jgi:hypothetical protein
MPDTETPPSQVGPYLIAGVTHVDHQRNRRKLLEQVGARYNKGMRCWLPAGG